MSGPFIVPRGRFPDVGENSRKHLEPEELKKLFNKLERDPFWYGYFFVQYYFGCRVSEPALILREEVDFENKRIAIRRLKKARYPRKRVPRVGPDGNVLLNEQGKTRTKFVYDKEAVPGPGFESFEYQLPEILCEALGSVPIVDSNPWLFPSSRRPDRKRYGRNRLASLRRTEGNWSSVSRATAYNHFREAASAVGISRRLQGTHTLRHTRATLLLAAGAEPSEVKYLLGHASINTTMHYLGVAKTLAIKYNTTAKLGLGILGE